MVSSPSPPATADAFATTTRLLASKQWQSANPLTHAGLLKRLTLIRDAGLPPMQLLRLSTLTELNRIPRSDENHWVGAIEAVRSCGADTEGKSKAAVIFFSHRWLRPHWCEAVGRDVEWGTAEWLELSKSKKSVGHPDSATHDKAKALIEWCKWFRRVQASGVPRGSASMRTANGLCYPATLHPHTYQMSTARDLQIFLWIGTAHRRSKSGL